MLDEGFLGRIRGYALHARPADLGEEFHQTTLFRNLGRPLSFVTILRRCERLIRVSNSRRCPRPRSRTQFANARQCIRMMARGVGGLGCFADRLSD